MEIRIWTLALSLAVIAGLCESCNPPCKAHYICYKGKCELDEENIAAPGLRMSCSASSEFSKSRSCAMAYNGRVDKGPYGEWVSNGEGKGGWIKLDFAGKRQVSAVDILPRCQYGDQCLKLKIEFSDGKSFDVTRKCNAPFMGASCKNIPWETYKVNPVHTTESVKIKCLAFCTKYIINYGYREVSVWQPIKHTCQTECNVHQFCDRGICKPKERNVCLPAMKTTCRASSQLDAKQSCEMAMNGKYGEGPGQDWVTNKQGSGGYVMFFFDKERVISTISLLPKCLLNDQCQQMKIAFSDGYFFKAPGKCNGARGKRASCSGIDWINIDIEPRRVAKFVGIECLEFCTNSGNVTHYGYREVEIWQPDMINIVKPSEKTTCQASSAFNKGYSCAHAMNGKIGQGEGNEWASKGQGQGGWIEFLFANYEQVSSISVMPRCAIVDQCSELEISFSDGHSFKAASKCYTTKNCHQVLWQTFEINPSRVTSTVRIRCTKICGKRAANIGFREVQIYKSIKDTCKTRCNNHQYCDNGKCVYMEENMAQQCYQTTVQCVSNFNAQYTCGNIMNGLNGWGHGNE